MIPLALLVAAALFYMLIVSLVNVLTFPRLRPARPADGSPLVSVLIPARNESAIIAATVNRLAAQTYAPLEIIVLDDNSDDDTARLTQTAAADHPGFRLISGSDLPPGWLGKNWACHQLSQHARGDILVFSDADVAWQPEAIAALVAQMQSLDAGLLAVWPTQQTETWGERLVVPLMALTVWAYLPLPLVHHTPWRAFAAANGQCLAFRRRAYDAIDGHQSVRASIIEDVALARRSKYAGEKLRMTDAAGLITCRMYESWPAVRDGYAKNIIAGFGGIPALLLATAFHWLVFLAPWLWLALGWLIPAAGWPLVPAMLVGLGLAVRAITAAATRQRMRDALLMPISVILMTIIAAKAIWWQWRQGGPSWKGRVIRANLNEQFTDV